MPRKDYETYPTKYTIKKDSHSTRHFKQIHYIYTPEGDEVGYIAHDPCSEILKADSGLFKLNNKYLYQVGLKEWVIDVLKDLGMEFMSISRIDLALDFQRFNNNLDPANFIKKFLTGDYIKKGRFNWNIQGKGGQTKGLAYETLKFGSPDSDVQYYLYNKTGEMKARKHKQWIEDNWKANGYDGTGDVWRLEYRLKKTKKGIYKTDYETGEMELIFDMTTLDCLDNLNDVYSYLFNHYFSFVRNEKKIRKDRCKPVTLFSKGFETRGIAIKLSEKKESDRSARIMAKHLQKLEYEMKGLDFHLAILSHELTGYFIQSRGLTNWAEDKLKYIVSDNQAALYNQKRYSSLLEDRKYLADATGRSHNIVKLLQNMKAHD